MKKTIGTQAGDYVRAKGNHWSREERAALQKRFLKIVKLSPEQIDEHLKGKTPARIRQEIYELESGEPIRSQARE
jgi:hypothetical protein